MAMARLNRPAVFVYGGTILPGVFQGQPVDIVSVFEAVGQHAAGKLSDAALADLEQHACPGRRVVRRHVHGQHHGVGDRSAGPEPAEQLRAGRDLRRQAATTACAPARRSLQLIEHGIRPRDILTRKAFENAITMVIALGGSTNAVLHLLAMAHAAGVKLSIDDFTRIGKRVPVLADLKPSGKYVMAELVKIGGLTPLMKRLLDRGLLHGDAMTVTGQTLAENLARRAGLSGRPGGRPRLRQPDQEGQPPRHARGNLAPDGAVAKISGKEGRAFTGTARVFDREEDALAAILAGRIKKGDVIVIRYEGPRGGPGHARDAVADQRDHGPGPWQRRGAHHRRPIQRRHARIRGRPHHARSVRRRTAGAREERRRASRSTRERRTLDARRRREGTARPGAKTWRPRKPRYTRGVLAKYARLVSTASNGRGHRRVSASSELIAKIFVGGLAFVCLANARRYRVNSGNPCHTSVTRLSR